MSCDIFVFVVLLMCKFQFVVMLESTQLFNVVCPLLLSISPHLCSISVVDFDISHLIL